MRNRMYGGVRGRKTKVGEKLFVFLLLDSLAFLFISHFSFLPSHFLSEPLTECLVSTDFLLVLWLSEGKLITR